jgi:endonuclease/exonuclease/phosphatase family metal-dependent hydrolase
VISLLLAVLVLLVGCADKAAAPLPVWQDAALAGPRISVMTFNVENLFDAQHDAGKNDYDYLPLAAKQTAAHRKRCAKIKVARWRAVCLEMDWTHDVMRSKMAALAPVVLQVGGGKGADIVILQEVENYAVLEELRSKHLALAEYHEPILLEGDDYRGIDMAILSRLNLVGRPQLHKIPFAGMTRAQLRDSRGILQAAFELPGGETLHVFAVHLPAPFHPHSFRAQALAHLKKLRQALPEDALVVAGGDFNVPADEDAAFNVWEGQEDAWLVSHRIGCAKCQGSSYYHRKKQWSFLDVLLLSKAFHPSSNASWTVLRESVHVANEVPEQVSRFSTPARWDAFHATGVSDHWPIVLTLAEKK